MKKAILVKKQIDIEPLRTALAEYLQRRKMRNTIERQTVLEYVCSTVKPYTAAQVLDGVRSTGFYISKASIYNTLDLFTDCGIIAKVGTAQGLQQFYVTAPTESDCFLLCKRCGRLHRFTDKKIIQQALNRRYQNFTVHSFVLVSFGVCNRCWSLEK